MDHDQLFFAHTLVLYSTRRVNEPPTQMRSTVAYKMNKKSHSMPKPRYKPTTMGPFRHKTRKERSWLVHWFLKR